MLSWVLVGLSVKLVCLSQTDQYRAQNTVRVLLVVAVTVHIKGGDYRPIGLLENMSTIRLCYGC